MMKRLWLLFFLSCKFLCASEPIVLERISVERINSYTLEYQKELKRLGVKQKLFYGVGASVLLGGVAALGWKFAFSEKKASEGIFKSETIDPKTFQDWVKFVVISSSVSFAGKRILDGIDSFWNTVKPGFPHLFRMFSAKNKIERHERLVGIKGKYMATMVAEYERLVARAIDLGGNEPITLSFVAFMEQQIIHQNEAFVRALEDVLACLYAFNRNKHGFEQELNTRLVEFSSVIDVSSREIEGMLNAPLGDDKLVKCKKGVAACKEVALYAERFATDCCSFILGRDS